jgi:hypothetical protein
MAADSPPTSRRNDRFSSVFARSSLAGLQLTLPSQTVELLDRPTQAQTPVSLGPLNQPRQACHAPVSTLSEPCWEPHRGTPIPFTKWTKNRIQEPSPQRICSENQTFQSSDAPGTKKLSAIPPKMPQRNKSFNFELERCAEGAVHFHFKLVRARSRSCRGSATNSVRGRSLVTIGIFTA